jgi:hypothetical protein
VRRASIALISVACTIVPALGRDTLPHACTISPEFAASLPASAATRYDTAERERTALSNQIASFEGQCASVPENTPAYNTCVALNGAVDANIGTYLRLLEDNQVALRAEVAAVRADAVARIAALDRKIADTRAKLAVDGRRISGIEAAAKEWEDMSEEARLQVEKVGLGVYFDTIIDASLLRLSNNRAAQLALDQKELTIIQNMIGELALPMGKKMTAAEFDILLDWKKYYALRGGKLFLRIDANTNRLTLLQGLARFNKLLDIVDAHNALNGPDEREAILRSFIAVLKLGINDPGLKAIVNQWDLNFSLMYLFAAEYHAEQRVDQLSKLSEDELKGIASLSRLHKAQVDERAAVKRLAARAEVTNASGCPF